MARDLFIDLTNNRLAASETNLSPAAPPVFTKGDNGTFNLYFLQATGIINAPFTVVDRSTTSVKLGIGSRSGLPETGDYTLTFGGDTTSAIPAAATAGQIATALNALSAISSAGGVTVTGALEDHFTIRFATAGTRGSFTANVSQVIPDTVAVIDERLAGSATAKEVAELQLRLTPAVFQPTWTNLSTTVTATIATTVTGSGLQNEIQRLTFSKKPFAGTFRLTFPNIALTSSTTVTEGTFITTVTHGLALNQPITITGFDTTITGFTRGATVFVNSIPSVTSFLIATTAGGTTITTASATAATTAGSIATFLRQSDPLPASAVAADIATALQAFDSIGAGGVSVAGIDGEFADITFSGNKGFCDQPTITIQSGLTAKPGKTADVNFSTFALRDLIGSSNAVDLDLEIELTDSGTRQTVVLSGCSISEELIDANAFSPVPQFQLPINSVAVTAYTLALSDAQSLVSATTGMTITVPLLAWPTGSQIQLLRNTSGTVAITAGAGVTINAPGGADRLASQYSVGSLTYLGSNSFVLSGSIS